MNKLGASLRETGSHPSDHARAGHGAARIDPARLSARIAVLLHPTHGIKRGIIDRCETNKGGPDPDSKLIPVSVGELREVHAVLTAIANQEQAS